MAEADDPDPNAPMPGRRAARRSGKTPASIPISAYLFSTGNPGPKPAEWPRPAWRQSVRILDLAVTLEGKYGGTSSRCTHDLWDFDCPSPVVLFDRIYDGKLRKGMPRPARPVGSTSSTAPTESR